MPLRLGKGGAFHHAIVCLAEEGHQQGTYIGLAPQDEQPALSWGPSAWNRVLPRFRCHVVAPFRAVHSGVHGKDRGEENAPLGWKEPYHLLVTTEVTAGYCCLTDGPCLPGTDQSCSMPAWCTTQGSSSSGPARGSTKLIVVPWPSSDSTQIWPPCRSINSRQRKRPNPVPLMP